jgi:hypothetical protein
MFVYGTSQSLELEVQVAGNISYACSVAAITSVGAGSPAPASHGAITTATTVAIVSASAQGTDTQQVNNLNIHNNGTASNTIRLKKDVSGTEYPLVKAVLLPGESLGYTKEKGFYKTTSDGSEINATPNFDKSRPVVASANIPVIKGSIATQVTGAEASLWRGNSLPAQGAIPAAAASVCTNLTLGALPLIPRSGSQIRLLTGYGFANANASASHYVEDRLAHNGSLSGIVATAQTVGVDASLTTNNLPARIGAADYSEVLWFMEWYTATGATATTPVFNVTHNDNTTGTANVWVAGATALPINVAASRRYQIIAANGKPIKSIQSVTMPTTGTAGSFGVTALRRYGVIVGEVSNRFSSKEFAVSTATPISDEACLGVNVMCSGITTGAITGYVTQTIVEPVV